MMTNLMNNLQENEEKLVKGLYITAAAHPVTQRVQKLNWPQRLHNAEEHKAGLCLTGQRSWSLHKRRITRWSVKHNQPYPVLQLLTSRDSDHHDLSPQMIIPPTSYSIYHMEAFFSHIFTFFQSQLSHLHTLNLNLHVFHFVLLELAVACSNCRQ